MNTASKNIKSESMSLIAPSGVRIALVILFSLLWAIWIQPHTIFLRHAVLISGSLLGLYVILQNRALLWRKTAIPIYLIFLLLAWVGFHLLFLSNNFSLQLEEFSTIWKRVLMGLPFAIGLGIAIHSISNTKLASNKTDVCWWVFFCGLCAPSAIYLLRYILTVLAQRYQLNLPEPLLNLAAPSTWYVPKTAWVFFCLPALAVAWAQFLQAQRVDIKAGGHSILYLSVVVLVSAVFYLENIKNGMIYSVILIGFGLANSLLSKRFRWTRKGIRLLLILAIVIGILGSRHLQANRSWNTFMADTKVAEQMEKIDLWKFAGQKGYPKNALGDTVSITNYERMTWAQAALKMIKEQPLGYGLVWKSFGVMAKERWPDSVLTQSHSAWLDLTLGIGIPGVGLILLASFMAMYRLNKRVTNEGLQSRWQSSAIWWIGSILLLMFTTEVSQKTYIDALIFVILYVASTGLGDPNEGSKPHAFKNLN
jgi:hypothetical protein